MYKPPKIIDAPRYDVIGKWNKVRYYSHGIYNRVIPNKKKYVADLGLKVTGAALGYGVGWLVGETIEHIPYIRDGVQYIVDFIGIGTDLSLDALVARLGALDGLVNSGLRLCKRDLEPMEFEEIKLGRFGFSKGNVKGKFKIWLY